MKEEYGEADILEFFQLHGILARKNQSVWFFDTKIWTFRKNKSNFIIPWLSDITAIIEGRHIAIEVKTKAEMSFFDRPIEDLKQRLSEAKLKSRSKITIEKYLHAVQQRQFLNDTIASWWVWFFADSVKTVVKRLEENKYFIY